MCRIVGYIGKQRSKAPIFEGLERLEYGGYDSAGFAVLDQHDHTIHFNKVAGGVASLIQAMAKNPIDGFVGIGHTRWATHGVSSQENAHPHFDCLKTISVVHNGIIENYLAIKQKLVSQGHHFHSQTDTEVAAHLLESAIAAHKNLLPAVIEVVNTLQGAFALGYLMQEFPDSILIIRKGSPLCVGIADEEMYISSDPLAFAGKTNKVLFLPDKTFALVRKSGVDIFDFEGKPVTVEPQELSLSWSADAKEGFEHFMLKEIFEQKRVIYDTVRANKKLAPHIVQQMGLSADALKNLKSITLLGCGTSYHAAKIAQFYFEIICGIPTKVHLASEFRFLPFFEEKDSLYIGISQSGETADTLECIRFLNAVGAKTVAFTNVASSTAVRESQGFLLMHAGPEIAVASTKAFTAQVAGLYWLAHFIALHKGLIAESQLPIAEEQLLVAAEVLINTIEIYKKEIIDELAPRYAQYKNSIFLGRHIGFVMAQEASLKLKEISYIFTDCYPAGELKHGSLALVDAQTPVFLFSVLDPRIYQKTLSCAQEVKARHGHLVVFAFEDQKELIALADFAFVVPRVDPLLAPVAMTGLMQFFVYQIAKVLGRPIDKPRNLAKSVTVE